MCFNASDLKAIEQQVQQNHERGATGATYQGFNTHAMLLYISDFYDDVLLRKVSKNHWCLELQTKGGEKIYHEGGLFKVLSKAFSPFVKEAMSTRKQVQSRLDFDFSRLGRE
ncbi:hypothetical protein [Photobacterium sp. Hal280]|uniref:hypothetical protein n=1 Tax=Photobacterium sp. Hal280 TaxID=3035163 RepID=UPI00301BED02